MIFLRPLALGLFAILTITSCGGNPPPRPSGNRQNVGEAVRVAAIPRTPPPPVAAESVLVVDLASGRNLYAKNADSVRPVASTQKIITALCVLDAGDIDKPVVISSYDTACEPTKLYLKPGERYTRRELLKVLMVKCANDVARALARECTGRATDAIDVAKKVLAAYPQYPLGDLLKQARQNPDVTLLPPPQFIFDEALDRLVKQGLFEVTGRRGEARYGALTPRRANSPPAATGGNSLHAPAAA
jgi:hypothetical protein